MKRHGAILLAILSLSSILLGAGEPQLVPEPRLISRDLYDMTARWQVMFGLDGKLGVSAGRTYQVHTVRLRVHEAARNSKPPVVSPDATAMNSVISAAPGSTVRVRWSCYRGGEGVAGGWQLMSVSHSETKFPPSVPGYEQARGD